MEKNAGTLRQPFRQPPARVALQGFRFDGRKLFYRLITFGTLFLIWHLAARHYNNQLVLPTPWKTAGALVFAVQDAEILRNLALTLKRVMFGLGIALAIGLPVGLAMGYSQLAHKLVDPIIGPLRQVPIMAWVPLTIVSFGLGEGPTLFLIAMVATFPIMLSTMAGVQGVPKNYYHAARSMGAGPMAVFTRITLPGALPEIFTGMRIGLSSGWMSVIWAEFIATSAGFGFSMIEAQTEMETPLLIALMIMAALVGYGIDLCIIFLERGITRWRFVS